MHTKRGAKGVGKFHWSPNKRQAVRLLVRGWSVRDIGREVGVHFTSVQRWKGNPDFQIAVVQLAREQNDMRRFRDAHVTRVIGDQLAAWALRFVRRAANAKDLRQIDLNRMALFLREYRAFRKLERHDHAEFIEAEINPPNREAKSRDVESFREWLETAMRERDSNNRRIIQPAR